MAKQKFDTGKPRPTAADISDLAETMAEYAAVCQEAEQSMRQNKKADLLVSNWDTVKKSLVHIDNFMRQIIASTRFGSLDTRIHALIRPDEETTQQAATEAVSQDAAPAHKKPRRKGGSK